MRVGLIGLGMVAGTHVAAIRDAGLTLGPVLGRDPGRAATFAEAHGARLATDARALARDSDFVILATPPNARDEIVRAVVAEGRPILTEKPVERDLPRARAIVEICDRAGIALGVMLQHRMREASVELLARLPSLGRIGSVELRVPWWRDPSYYAAPGRGTWARDGGGVMISQAIHAIDMTIQACGPVAEVRAMTATTPLHALEAEDFAAAALRFRSGATGSLMTSVTHRPGGTESLVVNATRGSARLEGGSLVIHPDEGEPERFGEAGATGGGADPMDFGHAWHQAVIEDFALAVRTGRDPAITGRSALPAQALIDAIQRAARSGRTEEVADA